VESGLPKSNDSDRDYPKVTRQLHPDDKCPSGSSSDPSGIPEGKTGTVYLDDIGVHPPRLNVHISDDSRQRKEKLSSRTQMCLLLGYSTQTKGYKLLNLRTGSVTTSRGGSMKAHEQYTVQSLYVEKLLLNTYAYGDFHRYPSRAYPDNNADVRGAARRSCCAARGPDGETSCCWNSTSRFDCNLT
jgi:hypothetical protein